MTQLRVLALLLVLAVAAASWVLTCAAWRADRVVAGVVPLDPRRFEAFALVTLGTGGARENPGRLGPATAVVAATGWCWSTPDGAWPRRCARRAFRCRSPARCC